MFKVQRLKAGPGLTAIVPDRQRKTRALECLRELKEKDGRDKEQRRQVAPQGIVLLYMFCARPEGSLLVARLQQKSSGLSATTKTTTWNGFRRE